MMEKIGIIFLLVGAHCLVVMGQESDDSNRTVTNVISNNSLIVPTPTILTGRDGNETTKAAPSSGGQSSGKKGNVTSTWSELDTWEAPIEIRRNFPYYLSGYDDEERPIWIAEMGKYPIRQGIVDKGPEMQALFEKYVRQVQLRIRNSRTRRNPDGKEINFLLDFDELKLEQFADLQTMSYILKLATAYRGPLDNVIHVVVLVNTNYITETLINLVRPVFGRIFAKVEIYGTNRAKWLPRVLQYFPKDQLPEWYGGTKDFTPVEIHG